MKFGDFPFAVQLANTMNWNMTVEDFEFMAKLEPQGCFVQFHRHERVGIATCISFGKVGWFGNFVVKEDCRGEGAGSILIKHSMNYLKNKGVKTIGLYAYSHLVKFYESFGFKPDIKFLALQGKAASPAAQEPQKKAKRQDFPEVIDLDCRCFGANRRKLIEPILRTKGNLCYVSTENKEITGYVVAKVYGKIAEVGPLICGANSVKVASLLLKTILRRLNGFSIFAYIPKKETELLNILIRAGLREDFEVVKMFMGPAIEKNCIYTAESLERG